MIDCFRNRPKTQYRGASRRSLNDECPLGRWCFTGWRRSVRRDFQAERTANAKIQAQRTSFVVKLMSIESVMPSNCLILCLPLFLLCSIFPSIRVFSNEESALHIRWPKYWSFSISPSSEYSGLIFFRTDWFDLLAVQGTLKSLLQHHSSKTSILPLSTFFTAQHRYMTTGKTIALTIQTVVVKVLSLLLNMLFRVIIAFLPRSKHLLISWLLNMF